MSASAKCLQVVLALFNLIFLVFGVIVLIFSVSYLTQSSDDSSAHSAGLGLAGVGAASILIGIFGCIGAFCRSRCALIVYSVCLVCLIIAQCVTGGVSLTTSSNSQQISEYASSVWGAMNDQSRNDFQQSNQCCGFNGPLDRPGSSCPANISSLEGCSSDLMSLLKNAFYSSGLFLILAAGCEVVAIAISLILIFDQNKRQSGYGRSW